MSKTVIKNVGKWEFDFWTWLLCWLYNENQLIIQPNTTSARTIPLAINDQTKHWSLVEKRHLCFYHVTNNHCCPSQHTSSSLEQQRDDQTLGAGGTQCIQRRWRCGHRSIHSILHVRPSRIAHTLLFGDHVTVVSSVLSQCVVVLRGTFRLHPVTTNEMESLINVFFASIRSEYLTLKEKEKHRLQFRVTEVETFAFLLEGKVRGKGKKNKSKYITNV